MRFHNTKIATRFALMVLCVGTPGQAQSQSPSIPLGTRIHLSSAVLDEERELWISLPPSYDKSSSRYPVLYLLDGEWDFHHVTGIVEHLSRVARMPEAIVVGIANTDRIRDFTPVHSLIDLNGKADSALLATTGGGERFRTFLANELIPYIENHYRSQPYRILAGHSLGGVFATYVLETSPELFNSYIDISPAFYGGNLAVLNKVGAFLRTHAGLSRNVFVAIGNEPLLRSVVDSLVGQLRSSAPQSLRWTFREYENEDHASVPHLAMYDGLRFIYSNWWIDVLDTNKVRTFEDLKKHYRQLSVEFGIGASVPEDMANTFGYRLMYTQQRIDEAMAVFLENTRNYPDSFNVYDSLGEAYSVKGNKRLAIQNYEKSVKLNPQNEAGKRMLEKLRK